MFELSHVRAQSCSSSVMFELSHVRAQSCSSSVMLELSHVRAQSCSCSIEISDTYIYIFFKYSTLPRGISINIAPKVGTFPEAEGRGKYSLTWVQYYRYSTRKGGIFILLHRLSLYNCANLLEHQSSVILDY